MACRQFSEPMPANCQFDPWKQMYVNLIEKQQVKDLDSAIYQLFRSGHNVEYSCIYITKVIWRLLSAILH